MGIFSDAQEQLTTLAKVRSGRISNSSENLWMSSTCKNEEFESKIKALDGHNIIHRFLDTQGR